MWGGGEWLCCTAGGDKYYGKFKYVSWNVGARIGVPFCVLSLSSRVLCSLPLFQRAVFSPSLVFCVIKSKRRTLWVCARTQSH